MLKSYRVHRLLTMLAILGGFGMGHLIMALPDAMAKPRGFGTNVVVMDCGETDDDTFAVADISSTENVGVSIDDDCALALQTLLVAGYKIVPGGGGGIFDSTVANEHLLYTLVKRGFGIGLYNTPHSFNFPNP